MPSVVSVRTDLSWATRLPATMKPSNNADTREMVMFPFLVIERMAQPECYRNSCLAGGCS